MMEELINTMFYSMVYVVFIPRSQKQFATDSDVTLVMPDFSRSEVDALLRVLYGRDSDDGVSEELLKALGLLSQSHNGH